MARFMIFGLLTTGLCLTVPTSSEKQIKLEDIEKDNLQAAQRAKLEKQYQQYQQLQQYQQYIQSPVQYDQQAYSQQPSVAYPSTYYQYSLPQQYVQQQQQQPQFYSGYAPLASNSLGAGYSTASSVDPFQAYYTPQLTSAVPSLQGSQHIAASTQSQPIIMTIPQSPLTGLQQQAYYQVLPKTVSTLGNVQYVPGQTAQAAQYYYQPQAPTAAAAAATPANSGLLYAAPQQYIPSYQYLSGGKVGASYPQQYLSTAPQTFSSAYTASGSDYTASAYPTQGAAYSASSVYTQPQQPTFLSVKAPQHLVASPGQQQQYIQAQAEAQTQTTTISPFKYLNSPQYLAQNYNTIQSSHFLPRNTFSAGIKSTVSPPTKFGNTGYITSSSSSVGSSSSSNGSNGASYHTYRGIAG